MFTDTCRFFFTANVDPPDMLLIVQEAAELENHTGPCRVKASFQSGGNIMFKKGEYIIYGRSGICKIEDITQLSISGADKKRLYYELTPLNIKGNRVYFPVDKKDANARKVITEQEAWALLDEIPNIEEIGVTNEKLREESYKQALNSCDYRQWVAVPYPPCSCPSQRQAPHTARPPPSSDTVRPSLLSSFPAQSLLSFSGTVS